MLRQAPKVWLSQEQREDLERSARSRTLPVRLVERAQIVLGAAIGWDNQQIAKKLGLCRQAVGRWRERCAAEGLRHKPRATAISRLSCPAAARSTIRDRSTSRASSVRLRENRSRSSRCSALNDTLGARRRMVMPMLKGP